jgi:protein-tyrosine sulfotransferase
MEISLKKSIPDNLLWIKKFFSLSTTPFNRNEDYRPFFIIGSGRSGNTLLRRILFTHPDLHIPPESYVLGEITKMFIINRNMVWKELVYLTLSYFEYYPEFGTFNLPTLRPLAQQLLDTPIERRSLAYILDSFYRHHAKVIGNSCKRWGDKTPLNTFSLERIFNIFPNAQFIHIVRDGCDVVYSYIQAGIYSSLEDAANRWNLSVEEASSFTHRHPSCSMQIKYEDLVQNSDITILDLCKFLEEEYFQEMVTSTNLEKMGDVMMRDHHKNIARPIFTSSIGRGRKNFGHEEKSILQGIIGEELERMGYEKCI